MPPSSKLEDDLDGRTNNVWADPQMNAMQHQQPAPPRSGLRWDYRSQPYPAQMRTADETSAAQKGESGAARLPTTLMASK
jgi:hypothetical protein